MIARTRTTVCLIALLAIACTSAAPAFGFAIPLSASRAQVWVAGRQIPFASLGIAYGDPVAPVDDSGLQSMLGAVAARASWQPGTGFVAITRADGKLITLTEGSNAVSVDGTPRPMPFAPFSAASRFYLPLLPLARALGLGVRGFREGYVFVPQITLVSPSSVSRAVTLHIEGSAPLNWHSAFSAAGNKRTLTISFPGFGTDIKGYQPIRSKVATGAAVSESGPPGYPTTAIAIDVSRGAKFVTRRMGVGADIDVVLAATDAALHAARPASTPSAVRVGVQPLETAPPRTVVTRVEQATPSAAPSPTTVIEPAPSTAPQSTEVPTAQPLGPETESPSPAPSAQATPAMVEQKITDVSVVEGPNGTRITLTLTGPVSFEWHRLADPDNRYWLDIDRALLVGPAQTLASALPFIKEVKISQHALVPDKVVRLSITPLQAIDVRVGTIEGEPNQLGIEIERQPPAADAPMAGIGDTVPVTVAAGQSPQPSPTAAAVQSNLIVIDPGHGGSDPGSLNPAYGLTESDLTLAISHRLAADLKRQGWQVTLTRDGNYDVGDPDGSDAQELQARCDVANASGARLFVSVHINASVSSAPNGATTYYWHLGDKAFADAVQNGLIAATGIANDGVLRNNFYVIHHTVMPSILVEAAYLSNPHDATLLTQASFLDKVAAGIARGIGDFTGGP